MRRIIQAGLMLLLVLVFQAVINQTGATKSGVHQECTYVISHDELPVIATIETQMDYAVRQGDVEKSSFLTTFNQQKIQKTLLESSIPRNSRMIFDALLNGKLSLSTLKNRGVNTRLDIGEMAYCQAARHNFNS